MTPDETIECGFLLEKLADGRITSTEMRRLEELQRRAKTELPTGETEIAAALRVDVEWQQRWGDLGRFLEKLGKEAAELVLQQVVQQLPGMIEGALKPK